MEQTSHFLIPEGWVNLAYVLASILFISGLKGLTHPRTAVRGNLTSAWGMLLAVLVTLLANGLAFQWILLGAVIGGLIGAAAYMVTYSSVKATGVLAPIAGGKTTLGVIAGAKYPSLFGAVSGELLGLILGVVMIAIAAMMPERIVSHGKRVAPAE